MYVSWAAAKAAKIAAATARSSRSKEIPNAKDPNALSGLAFVFTGELDRFSRDEAIDLAKRFGGYVPRHLFLFLSNSLQVLDVSLVNPPPSPISSS